MHTSLHHLLGTLGRAFCLLALVAAQPTHALPPTATPAVAVGPQYDTTHVYVAPADVDRFVRSFVATFGGQSTKQVVVTVTPTPSSTTSQLVQTPAGTISVFGFSTPVPYPFGAERNGYLVTDLDVALKAARQAGADVLVSTFPDPIGRDAIVQWPGGVNLQLYWHTTKPDYPPFSTVPENRVYVSPDRAGAFVDAFLAFSHGKVVSDDPDAAGSEIGRAGRSYRRVRLESTFGKMTVLVTDGHLPYPYGRETTGYEVADLGATLTKAQAAGVRVLQAPVESDGRSSAMVEFPGGYVAEIHGSEHALNGNVAPVMPRIFWPAQPGGHPAMKNSLHALPPTLGALSLCLYCAAPQAQETAANPQPAARPAIKANRWQEDWSALADPALRTEPLDDLKYIGLPAAGSGRYASLGLTLRERFESNDAPGFGVGGTARDSYVLQRLQVHADVHFAENLRLFTQLEDDRAFKKTTRSPADQDRVDLRLAFIEYDNTFASGTLKARVGRQDFAFDLQRFVSSRDGPNVRQSFDAVWADWETPEWRFIGFVSQPVQYKDEHSFDDSSNGAFKFDTLRIERHVLGKNELSAYWSLYERDNAHFGDASGHERRNVFDMRFAGAAQDIDWDVEGMVQSGSVGGTRIRAWGAGARAGYTFATTPWRPRAGIQVDAASGDKQHGDGTLGTFNPLFPNGYYFTLAGYTGYANLVHVKPSITLKPIDPLSITTAVGFLWRETTSDSIYLQPNVPVAGTAAYGKRWTGSYAQLRTDYAVNRNLTTALEAVTYSAGDTIRSRGGHDSTYLGLEMKYSW